VVVFIRANARFPIDAIACCGPRYARRLRYARADDDEDLPARRTSRLSWLPLPRDGARQRVARTVDAAVRAAADYRAQVRVLDVTTLFTPNPARPGLHDGQRQADARRRAGRHPPQRGGLGAGGKRGAAGARRGLQGVPTRCSGCR
jgi:hypothetical protein